MNATDRGSIKNDVRKAYGKIASQEGHGCCGGSNTDLSLLSKRIGYSDADIAAVPEGANLGLGCGNPTAITQLRAGETVLDLGSGAGFDCFLAAQQVGKSGKVIGVDMTPEMVEKARKNAKNANYPNVEFREGEIENLPVKDNSVDVVISNCVINLSPDKKKVFGEIYRVLKPGGRAMISDIVLKRPLPERVLNNIDAYVACVSGAMLLDEYVDIVGKCGLENVEVIVNAETSCADTDSQDPVIKKLISEVEDRQILQNSILSINVSASKG